MFVGFLKASAVTLCLAVAAVAVVAGSEASSEGELLRSPGQDVHLEATSAEVFAHFKRHSDGLELHVLVHDHTDEDGVMRTRTVLDDGARYVLRLDLDDGASPVDKRPGFAFQRTGDQIVATVLNGKPTRMAGYLPIFRVN